jgi:hypothetical protein
MPTPSSVHYISLVIAGGIRDKTMPNIVTVITEMKKAMLLSAKKW